MDNVGIPADSLDHLLGRELYRKPPLQVHSSCSLSWPARTLYFAADPGCSPQFASIVAEWAQALR